MIRERKLVIRIKKKAGRPMADTSPALPARQRARLGLALCGALLLAGCGYNKLETGTVAYVEGFAGIIVGDEPRAVLIGRDILTTGGSAADAAVATEHQRPAVGEAFLHVGIKQVVRPHLVVHALGLAVLTVQPEEIHAVLI